MTTALISLLAAPVLLLGVALFYSRLVNNPCRTVSEAIVRWLFLLARWFAALAEASDSWVIGYRECKRDRTINPMCEEYGKEEAA